MITLYRDEKKNEKIKRIIADLRNTQRSLSFKYYSQEERAWWVLGKYDECDSFNMAKKIVWILTGDCARQIEICKVLGKEYAMYVPSSIKERGE